MNAISDRSAKPFRWVTAIMLALVFWLSSSLLLDFVIVPSLWASGMMNQTGFASAGYTIFEIFNHIELFCAALVLTGFLVLRNRDFSTETRSLVLSGTLVIIAIIYTYYLTPQMSGWGMQLNLFETSKTMPPAMISLHGGYWLLEIIKFVVGGTLLRKCYCDSCAII